MIQEKEECRIAVDAVYSLCEELRRGDVLTWEQIEQATGLRRWVGRFSHVMRRVRAKLLKEREIVTWPDTGVGLRFLTHAEAADLQPKRRFQRAARQCHRGVKELRAVDTSAISLHQRRATVASLQAMLETRRNARKAAREHVVAVKSKTLPRRPQTVK